MIESGPAFLFWWNKSGRRLHDAENLSVLMLQQWSTAVLEEEAAGVQRESGEGELKPE